MFKSMKGIIIILAVAILLRIAWSLTAVYTYPEEYTMIMQFGKVEKVISEPGLHFKLPFVQNTQSIPKVRMLYDLPVSDVTTADKKMMVADSFVIWQIDDPVKYMTAIGGNRSSAEGRINNAVYNSLKNVISSMNQEDIISGRDGELAMAIKNNLGGTLSGYGITIFAIETKRLDLPDENKTAVYNRMISERANIEAGFQANGALESTKIRNDTDKNARELLSNADKQAKEIIADGEAEYMKILSEAYNSESKADFYNYVRSLDALKASLKGDNKTIILDKDSELVKILYGK